MLRKLTTVILAPVVFLGFFSSNIVAETFEKLISSQIPQDQQVPRLASPLVGEKDFCIIKSDSGVAAGYFGAFSAGDGLALYMDPAQCGLPDPYPFKITDVHFYLYEYGGCTWPVEIQVNIRDLNGGDKCNGPGDSLCSQTYSVPQDSAYPKLIHLDLDSLCSVYDPFFLEIIYTGVTLSPYPSLMMGDSTLDFPDTCNAWLLWSGGYYEWSESWVSPPPGCPIMRITGDTPTAVEEGEEESATTPKDFELYQSYPNPFNNQTIIKYNLLKPCQVTLTIYNILGQKVKTLVNERQETGSRSISWDGKDEKGKDLSGGIYFYQLKAGEVTQTKRMVLLK